ncbi:hypothetical protein [Modicisalibacter radicis]|uniref:hypothetical protein n=1 Tax=Halomonas sp. EAR18 TaxID=2518972 RepID=UPI00109CBD08|nr:hypothetical protein [Halomonas sp. EAR18]
MKTIREIVEPEIQQVEDSQLREVLFAAYVESSSSLAVIQNCLEEITSQAWPEPVMCQFFKNWRNPAVGAGSFCALTCRLFEEACECERDSVAQRELFFSAACIAEVSNEDMGLLGPNHGELYEELATAFCGSDKWKLQRYGLPMVTEYLTEAREYLERGKDMIYALMISLAEELYNHGEFTYIAPLFKKWYGRIPGLDVHTRNRYLRFIFEHVGGTESGHFAYMTQGLIHYCRACGVTPDWEALGQRNQEYIRETAISFDRLCATMKVSNEQAEVV